MDPLPAHTVNEALYYLRASACPACGGGPQRVLGSPAPAAGEAFTLDTECAHCGARHAHGFVCEHAVPDAGPEAERINPTDEPSRVVDLAQWVGLFYLLIEHASNETSRAGARRTGYRAALCLAEALKFYGDDELPPESAFFSDETRECFRQRPQSFTKQTLRDRQSKLPALGAMAARITEDEDRRRQSKWWQFWRR